VNDLARRRLTVASRRRKPGRAAENPFDVKIRFPSRGDHFAFAPRWRS
jgi:hypothetical protein